MALLGSRPDRTEVLFRALCATGLAVRKNLEDLRSATQEPGIQDWLTILRRLDRLAINAYEEQASARASGHEVEWSRGQVKLLAQTLRADLPGREAAEVLERIAEDITPASDEDLLAQLESVHQKGRQLADQVVKQWGTNDVQARWAGCEPLQMELDRAKEMSGIRAITRGGSLVLQISDAESPEHSLLTYLSLDFQILHEYISHVLPVWDTSDGVFTEAYLFAAARWSYPNVSSSGTNVILADEEERRLVRTLNTEDVWNRRAQEIELSFRNRWVRQDRLTSLLLEIAVDQSLSARDKERLLAMFRSIWVGGEALDLPSRKPSVGLSTRKAACSNCTKTSVNY